MTAPLTGDALRPWDQAVAQAHDAARAADGGKVASYIPALASADPELLAVSVCTTEAQVFTAGDADHEFTIQSISKPFVYGRALQRDGLDAVHEVVGVEPTGDPFDSIIRLERSGRPHNPMNNAGAIAISAMFARGDLSGSVAELEDFLEAFAGRQLPGVDVPTFLSERAAGHRNRALAHLMRHFGAVTPPIDEVLDLYFQQCSMLVTTRDLSVMAATLANRGINPVTGKEVLSPDLVRNVLTIMATCGLYDRTGEFAFHVGLPAKTGVSGAIIAVAPGRAGIAAFSPGLDEQGNTVRGVVAVKSIADRLGLHVFQAESRRRHAPASTEEPTSLQSVLEEVAAEVRGMHGGEVAKYAPPLARANPDQFGIQICTIDGEEYGTGDVDASFSIQAAASPFTYAWVCQAVGSEAVHRRVGVEPRANPFHAIELHPETHLPFNPLANAGALAVCSLAPGEGSTGRLRFLLDGFRAMGNLDRVDVDAEVLAAEESAGDRNRAIASMLRNFGVIDDEDAALDLYLQQCSIRVTCRSLARLGAVLAGHGVAPGESSQVLDPRVVRDTLSAMYSSGLHDESGRFAFEVGLPAKSGISGGIVAIQPGRMAIAVQSPCVNQHGSSVRGIAAMRLLSRRLRLDIFRTGN